MPHLETADRAITSVTIAAPADPGPELTHRAAWPSYVQGVRSWLADDTRRCRYALRSSLARQFGAQQWPQWLRSARAALSRTAGVRIFVRFLVLAAVAIAATAVAATSVAIAARPFLAELRTDAVQGGELSLVAASSRDRLLSPTPPEFVVTIQSQAALLPGGSRQIRVSVSDAPQRGGQDARDRGVQLLAVTLEVRQPRSTRGTVSVTPSELTVERTALRRTQIDLVVAEGVACSADLGHLVVQVRDVTRGGTPVEVEIALPPVDCREPPPAIG